MEAAATPKQISRIPGSFLLGNLSDFKNDRLNLLLRVKELKGDVGSFRLGPMEVLVISSANLAHELLTDYANDFDGGPVARVFSPVFGQNSMILLDGPPHRRQRKALAPTFQPHRLGAFAEPMVQFTKEATDKWPDGHLLDVTEEMGHLTMRIAGKTLFDVDFDQESGELRKAMMEMLQHTEYMMSGGVPLPLSIPTARNRKARQAIQTLDNNIRSLIAERRRNGFESRKDLLSLLLNVRYEDGQPMDEEQLRDHMVTIYFAGHESTALTLSWALYMLTKHPEVYAKVRQEVDSALGSRLATFEDLPKLRYTLQTVKETLRLWPVVYMLARSALRDVVIDGYPIRKGQLVLMPPYNIHRDPVVYPEPERFMPERFDPEREKQIPRQSYLPFSAGPHTCIGNHFALMELNLMVATLMQQLDFELPPGQDIRPEVVTVSLRPSDYKLKVKKRKV